MGNVGSNGSGRRRHRNHSEAPSNSPPANSEPQTQIPQPESTANRFVISAAANPPAYPPTAPYYPYQNYYPPAVPTLYPQGPFPPGPRWNGGSGGSELHCGGSHPVPAPYVDHQKAVTIRNDVNVKKDTLRVVGDDDDPGKFLVEFTFDSTAPGSITIMFFAKEDMLFKHIVTKENVLKSVTVPYDQGIGQKFRQPTGTGIDFSMFDDTELLKKGEGEVYPLLVKAETRALKIGEHGTSPGNSQITQAVFEKDKDGHYQVRVMSQILWVDKQRYELQEIYGIGNTVEGDYDGSDCGKECVICLSEPRDTTVLPCRHMCMCSGCAKVLRFQTDRCPICRQPVERLLEIKVHNVPEG